MDSSDTATQYPRRAVRSEWQAGAKAELVAIEQHIEEQENVTDMGDELLTKHRSGNSCCLNRSVLFWSALFFLIVGIACFVAFGVNFASRD